MASGSVESGRVSPMWLWCGRTRGCAGVALAGRSIGRPDSFPPFAHTRPDFGKLRPVLDAAPRDLRHAGVTDTPTTAVADAGYWRMVMCSVKGPNSRRSLVVLSRLKLAVS